MKASQITTRNRKSKPVTKTLAAVAVLTFFVAGSADARCNKTRLQARYDNSSDTSNQTLSVQDDIQNIHRDLYTIPRVDVIRDRNPNRRGSNRGYGLDSQTDNFLDITPMYGNTTIPIRDTEYQRKRDEERRRRQAVIDALKASGVIREPGQPATTTNTGSDTGTTTTKPKPKPTPKPEPKPKKPKVTKLPNGDTITEYPDGRREIKMKNGDTVTTYKNGNRVIKRFNGDTTETEPGGYRKTTDRYGNGTARFPDGTRIDFKASGEATLTRPDGTKFHRMPGKQLQPVD